MTRRAARTLALAVGAALLASCSTVVPRPAIPAPGAAHPAAPATPAPTPPTATAPQPANAAAAGVRAGPDIATLGLTPEGATRALVAFRTSCPAVQRRADPSGLAQPTDWRDACTAAAGWTDTDAIRFFATYFRAVRVGDGKGLVTGYYEPEIAGSRTPAPGYAVPVYRLPADLVEVDLGQFSDSLAGRKLRGRVDGARLVPYFDRAAIDAGALAGRQLEIAWAADPVEFFFLQIQGSGRLRLPDGSVMRIGYAGQNGRDYTGIGRLLRDRGALGPDEQSMQGIMAYLRRQPDGGRAVMEENKSWVFFRELTGPGPIGALGVPVVARASVAADPAFVPLGAPVLLATDRVEANGLWIAQDTGGAITGANRLDSFWGAGADARTIAGGMSGRGDVYVLLPLAAASRLTAGR